jgi:hypothetical protein
MRKSRQNIIFNRAGVDAVVRDAVAIDSIDVIVMKEEIVNIVVCVHHLFRSDYFEWFDSEAGNVSIFYFIVFIV